MKKLSKEFGSYSATEPRIIAEKERENRIFGSFVGQKVTIKHIGRQDLLNNKGTKQGRIIQHPEGHYVFLPKGSRTKGCNLTLGLTDGFYATLTVDEIIKGWDL